MKEETKTIYKCEYCNKLYQRKDACIKHESYCFKNPEAKRACYNCIHLEKKKTSVYHDQYDGSQSEEVVELFHCAVKDIFLHPPKVEAKKNAKEISEENLPMPKECDIKNAEDDKIARLLIDDY